MKELLEELKKLDPACYDEIWRWALWLEDPDFGEYKADDPEYLRHRDDVIQGCVQRACGGWYLKQSRDSGGKLFIATIGEVQDRDWNDEWKGEGDSPAKAILTAYIAARKAHPCHS